MFQQGSPSNSGSRARRVPPPPINTQSSPASSMRQGRFLSPGGGGGVGGGGGPGSGGRGGGTSRSGGGGYHSSGPHQHQHPHQQQQQQFSKALSPTSQVRFEEEEHNEGPKYDNDGYAGHSPSFLFEDEDEGWSNDNDGDGENDDGDENEENGNHNQIPSSSRSANANANQSALPSEAQMTLLCLDYLRDLRRTYHSKEDMLDAEGLNADYVALAAWSLSRAFIRPEKLAHAPPKISVVCEQQPKQKQPLEIRMRGGGGLGGLDDEPFGNDAWYRELDDDEMENKEDEKNVLFDIGGNIRVPSMEDITEEVLLMPGESHEFSKKDENKENDDDDDDDDDDEPFYEHNDGHFSNAHRFYLLNGLASDASSNVITDLMSPRGFSPRSTTSRNSHNNFNNNANISTLGGPLSFGEIITAGLSGLRARSRIEAEKEMVRNPLFRQFVQAAGSGGFFQEKREDKKRILASSPRKNNNVNVNVNVNDSNDNDETMTQEDQGRMSRLLYEEKYRKVLNKFRVKQATKEAQLLQSQAQSVSSHHHNERSFSYNISSNSPSRMSSAYRIMSGNASVSSAGGGGGADSVTGGVGNAAVILANHDVAERMRMRRERRMERVKSDRTSTTENVRKKKAPPGLPRDEFESEDDDELPAAKVEEKEEQPQPKSPARSPSRASIEQMVKKKTQSPSAAANKKSPSAAAAAAENKSPRRTKSPVVVPAATTPDTEAEALNAEGNSQMQQKSFQKALATYTAAIQLAPSGPNSHVYYSNRSAAHLSLNNYESSIQDSEKSIDLKPDYGKAHSRLGLAYFACGRYRDAINAYEAALEIDPGNEWGKNHLEKAKEKCLSEARENADKEEVESEEKDENDDDRNTDVGEQSVVTEGSNWPTPFDERSIKGGDNWPEEKRGKNDWSEEQETKAAAPQAAAPEEAKDVKVKTEIESEENIAEKTRQANEHKDRGNEHMSKKEYETALQQYNIAIRISPSGPNSHVYYSNRAAAYCYLAEYQSASDDCRTSIELNPRYEKAHARLGLSLFFRGDYKAAIEAYKQSLELDPNNKASLSYLKKAKARYKDQQKKEVDEKEEQTRYKDQKKREVDEKEEQRRLRVKRQQQLQRARQAMAERQRLSTPTRGGGAIKEEEGEESDDGSSSLGVSSTGDATGITSTGLTSIVTNDHEEEDDGENEVPMVEAKEEGRRPQQQQEAFDPFDTTDEC